MGKYLQLLRENQDFRLLWSAQVVSLLGDWFNTIVLSTLVSQYSNNSGLAISIFLMARFLPPLIVGPFAGVLVDRFNRQKILVYSNVFRTGIVLLFLFASNPDMLWLIYVLTIAQFTFSALFEPAQSAITPSLIKREDYVIANTLSSITWSSMLAVGAIAGGLVAALFGSVTALLIDAMTFAVAAFLISRIDYSPADRVDLESTESPSDDRGFVDGLKYLRANPTTFAVLLVKGGSSIGNVDTLMTVLAAQVFVLGANSELSLGLMYSAFGIGAVLGPLVLNRFNDDSVRRMRRLVIIGFVWVVVAWFIMGGAGTLFVFCIGLVIRAMGGSANWTYSSVILQKTVPDSYLGRVFSLDLAFFQLATVVSTIGHGALIDAVGVEQILPIAIGTAAVGTIPLLIWLAALPRMERRDQRLEAVSVTGD